jgi:hypothetical protein
MAGFDRPATQGAASIPDRIEALDPDEPKVTRSV